jgi:hypothetical protein
MTPRARRLVLTLALCAGLLWVPVARAAGPPSISESWVEDVTPTSAELAATINPNGTTTRYHFELIAEAAYQENLAAAREGFSGATGSPTGPGLGIGAGTDPVTVLRGIFNLVPLTRYHYRAVAVSVAGTTIGPEHTLTTEAGSSVFQLLDGRGWEMVSPIDKNGGAIAGPGKSFGGGVFQVAADGAAATYSSAASFADPLGAPGASQYLSRRGSGSWATQNITTPVLSGSYGDRPDGVPYRLFSGDLARSLLLNGERCRGEGTGCPVANPPLAGSGAPAGYQNYYLRDQDGGFSALLSGADLAGLTLGPEDFELRLAGATSDLAQVVLSTCAALTTDATEVPSGTGCDPSAQNLYEWRQGAPVLINLLPGEVEGTPGAALAAQSGAISADGSRVYWTANEGAELYLREVGSATKRVDEAVGGGGELQVASSDGSIAYFIEQAHLYRYDAGSSQATDITPAGEVEGVLGASADGARVYYVTAAGLELWSEGATTEIAPGPAAVTPSSYPPATGTARVSADGTHLAFLSASELTDYDNAGATEAYVYGPGIGAPPLVCASCSPSGKRPAGSASIPGAVANGSTAAYKPRVLSSSGRRLFFDSSDSLVIQDTNNRPDVYEWEAEGEGSCGQVGGCVGLISSGRSPEASSFVDASASGSSAFFLTAESLFALDPGSTDLYVAREGGGFTAPPTAIPCNGDACQSLPAAPDDPTPGTLVPNAGNPPLRFAKPRRHHRGGGRKRGGKGKRGAHGKAGHRHRGGG